MFELFPILARAHAPAGGDALRRRAADAGARPRPDGAARSCCCSTSPRSASRRSSCSRSSARSPSSSATGVAMLLVEQNIVAGARARRPRLRAAHRRGQARRRRRAAARRLRAGRRRLSRGAAHEPRRSTSPSRSSTPISLGSLYALVGDRPLDGVRHPAHGELRPWRHDDGGRLRDPASSARSACRSGWRRSAASRPARSPG